MFFEEDDMTVGSDVAQTDDSAAMPEATEEAPASEEAAAMPEATEEAPASEEAAM